MVNSDVDVLRAIEDMPASQPFANKRVSFSLLGTTASGGSWRMFSGATPRATGKVPQIVDLLADGKTFR
jgi:hypothetical protein